MKEVSFYQNWIQRRFKPVDSKKTQCSHTKAPVTGPSATPQGAKRPCAHRWAPEKPGKLTTHSSPLQWDRCLVFLLECWEWAWFTTWWSLSVSWARFNLYPRPFPLKTLITSKQQNSSLQEYCKYCILQQPKWLLLPQGQALCLPQPFSTDPWLDHCF